MEGFAENKVGFITFNYDRSLEHFLCVTQAETFGVDPTVAGEVIKKIKIIHPHGRLAYLPWQSVGSRSYNSNWSKTVHSLCVQEIKVMHENADAETEEFKEAKLMLAEAERVYFLGVGFNNMNMRRLGVHDLKDDIAEATGVGLTESEVNSIRPLLNNKIEIHRETTCINLMRNICKWD